MKEEIISKELLDMLACPECRSELDLIQHSPEKTGLKCRQCGRIYPIEDGIPIMLVDQALQPEA
jgi:uncharacterized protein YbaR (Trm112 family)